MEEIKLNKLTQNMKVISGREKGIELREKLKLDEKDKDKKQYKIVIDKNVYSFNSSCFLGLFGKSIRELGEKKFREKYQFECTDLIRMNIEDGINDATNNVDTLR